MAVPVQQPIIQQQIICDCDPKFEEINIKLGQFDEQMTSYY